MTGVLAILAVLSIIGGFVGLPAALGGAHPTCSSAGSSPCCCRSAGTPSLP